MALYLSKYDYWLVPMGKCNNTVVIIYVLDIVQHRFIVHDFCDLVIMEIGNTEGGRKNVDIAFM